MQLDIVIASTRAERHGPAVAAWFEAEARRHAGFEVEVVDLKAVALPLYDEPNHPVKRQYAHAHTKAWSAVVDAADAFVFVVPEYNFGMPPALLNCFEYVFHEWAYKPAAFVSYGGVSGGTRSVQMAKMVLTSLKVMPIPEAVTLPFFSQHLSEGTFSPGDKSVEAAQKMLSELARWTAALATLRAR